MIRISLLLILLQLMLTGSGQAQVRAQIDSLETLLEKASPEQRVGIFCQMSELYWQSSYDTSLLMAIHAYNAAEDLDNPTLTATSLYMIGNAYYLLGDFTKSMDYYLQSLDLRKELGDSSDIASSYNNIGAVYLHLDDDQKALRYFKLAGDIFRALGDDYQLFSILNNIGAAYVDNEVLDTAFQYFNQAYEIAERSGNKTNLSIALANLGETALNMGLYKQSENYQLRAYEISQQLGDKGMMATAKANLGKLYLRRNELSIALRAFQESLVLAKEVNSLPIIQDNYRNLSDYYSRSGDHEQALRLYKLYASVKDSIMSQEERMKIKEMELKFNARALQQEIEMLLLDNEIQSLRQTRLKYGIFALAALILVLILLFLGYLQRDRYKKRTTRLLEDKNKELEKTNKKLQESEKHLRELNSTKDKFFSIIGHDLRNPLNALLGFSELMAGNSRDYSTEEVQKYSKIINEAAKNIHMLIENLLEWSRSQSGNIDFNPRQTDLVPIAEEILKIFRIQAEKKDISIESDLESDIRVFADGNLLSTILRNLISNAVKFTQKKGQVFVSAKQQPEGILISIKDTGVGMTEDQLASIFSLAHSTTAGTAEEKGTGLGLILCKEFVDKHGGRIWAESEPGKGSRFNLILPNEEK